MVHAYKSQKTIEASPWKGISLGHKKQNTKDIAYCSGRVDTQVGRLN